MYQPFAFLGPIYHNTIPFASEALDRVVKTWYNGIQICNDKAQVSTGMRIYVAGPYTARDDAGRLANTKAAMRAGLQLLRKGHIPFIPHLCHFFDLWVEEEEGQRLPWEIYMKWDDAFLECCEAFLYLAPSPGADRERQRAEELGLTVFQSVTEIP